jgi:hypothetical protein
MEMHAEEPQEKRLRGQEFQGRAFFTLTSFLLIWICFALLLPAEGETTTVINESGRSS